MSRDARQSGGAAARAHTHIRGGIMGGTYPPGSMLSENELATELSMSRTPVRAALARLQDEGWVRIYAQRGALVRELTATEIRESAEVRHALESAGVRRANPQQRSQLSGKLETNLSEQEQALNEGDLARFTPLALQFHRAFVELGHNDTMLTVYDRLQDRQYLSIIHSADRVSHDSHQVLDEHRALFEDAQAGEWMSFAAHLDEHQVRSHGYEGVASAR